jgi:hypothetical protein
MHYARRLNVILDLSRPSRIRRNCLEYVRHARWWRRSGADPSPPGIALKQSKAGSDAPNTTFTYVGGLGIGDFGLTPGSYSA